MRRMENVTFYASFLIKFSAQNHSFGKNLSVCVCVCTFMDGFSLVDARKRCWVS